MKKVLVFAVHPDDETLGCGGTLLKHKKSKDETFWLIGTNLSKEAGYSELQISKRKEEIKKVAKEYSFKDVFQLDFPTTTLHKFDISILINSYKDIIHKVKPEIIYLPYHADAHSDHRVAFSAMAPVLKSFRLPELKQSYMMETISETDYPFPDSDYTFKPDTFSVVDEFFEQKIEIMNYYQSEVMAGHLPRSESSIRALARFRGSQANSQYAESFKLIKQII